MPRTPEVQKAYQETLKHIDGCPLCWRLSQLSPQSPFSSFQIIPCDYPYDIYEGRKVKQHLMIISNNCQPIALVKQEMMKEAENLKPNSIIINNSHHASVNEHYHIHLVWTE